MVHTGPKSQLGGLNEGLLSEAYQPGMASAVKRPAMAPILIVRAIAEMSFSIFI